MVVAVALIAAAFTGISTVDATVGGAADRRFGLVRLDGLVGESLLLVGVALVGLTIAGARRRRARRGGVGCGRPRGSVVVRGSCVARRRRRRRRDFLAGGGSAAGPTAGSSRRSTAGSPTSTWVPTSCCLATAGAAALVTLGWVAWVELDDRRRHLAPVADDSHGPIADPSQDPHI
ncbi:MAG: hypothetical protein R2713_00145 [Ilumatobacteraceae bacterium]